ncbi:MAG: hypothetical protein OEV49_00565 [candidate division Zixibacteria bacterium]|nr:hypothetical protein [candidate division Zixibacteria bacterium]MDH3937019.1 hypothetical protein [candidate division Zixibacteria bacterium]
MSKTKLTILILAVCTMVGSVAVAQDAYPPSGFDVVNTTADVSIYDPADSNVLVEVVAMEGRAVIFRGNPYTAAGDILTIDTRMDTLLLAGFSLTQGDSIFATLDRSGPLSTGQIHQITAHVDFPAESFFDVYYKLTFGSAPNPPSPGQGPNDGATYRGSLEYDPVSQSAVLSKATSVGFSTEHSGTYEANKDGSAFCVDCSSSWKPELEPCGGDDNGGCNMPVPTFEPIDCGDTICGTAWADGGSRDTDWYEFTLTGPVFITVTGQADFDFVLGFVDTADCALASSVDPAVAGAACDVISTSRVAGPGTYWVFAAPNTGTGVNCGQNHEYWFALECTPLDYRPDEPPRLVDTIWQIPPHGRVYKDPRRRPVIDPVTGDTLGWVWHRHNVNPPDSANDTVPTTGIMNVWVGPNPPVPGQPADDVIELEGQAIIKRDPPQTDPASGQRTIQTEILSMDLVGQSPMFGQTILQLPQPAPGEIRGQLPSPQMFPADVFFDVDYEVFFPELGHSIIPMQPPVMQAQIEAIPPPNTQLTTNGEPHPVEDPQSPGVIIGWVIPIHWVLPPPPDPPPPPDTIPTIGIMPLIMGPVQPSPSQPPDETVELTGQAIIQRQAPQTDPATGQRTVQTEMLSMDLSGSSPSLGDLILSLPLPSPGEIRSQSPSSDFPADAFFDVFFDVEVVGLGHHVVSPAPIRMASVINEIPPVDNQLTTPDWHPLVDPSDPAGDTLGWTRPIHWVNPPTPTGACCEQGTGLCFITTAQQCADAQGTYQGDGTSCVPNPCDDDCPTGWTPGIDTILFSAFEIDVFDPNDNTIYLGTAYAFGAEMIVQRNAPYLETPGIWRMDTDILQFSGSGNSPLLSGAFTVGLDPNGNAGGYIRMCDSCNDNWAESFFDIDYQLSTTQAPPNNLLFGNAQMELPCSEGWDPSAPPHGHTYNDPRKVPILNAAGEIIGYTMKRHHVADDELGACCDLATGACRMTTAADCDPATEAWQGANTTCFPNPCICTGWTPGIDTILYSTFEVELFDPTDSTVSLGTLTAFGVNMIVQRGVPYEPVPGSGIWRMDTDILQFGGNGISPLTGGAFTLQLDPDLISGGFIQMCDSCNDNWAESFFDINYRILTSLPPPENILKGNAQMRLPCEEQWDPFPGGVFTPPNGHQYVDPRKVPIYDADGNLIGYTWKKHRVDKDPMGACCEPQGGILCFIATAAECEAIGGVYNGDGTVCVPNPCDTGCGTGWTPGVDTIPTHDFEIELYDNTGTILLTTLMATGNNMVVVRTAPFLVSPGFYRMGTQVVEFSGAGSDPVLGGPFEIHLNPNLISGGYIQMCDSCNDNWAESFFDIFYVITTTLPFPMDSLFGDPAQMHLSCAGNWDPFSGGAFTPPFDIPYFDPRIVPIFDHNGTVIGQTRKQHTPIPPGGCCQPPDRIRGDINCDGFLGIDISDLVYLVDYMFTGGPQPCCFEDVDVNCDGSIDISDLVYVVDYMFTGGPQPCRCDCLDCGKSSDASEIGKETVRKWSSHAVPAVAATGCRTGAAR